MLGEEVLPVGHDHRHLARGESHQAEGLDRSLKCDTNVQDLSFPTEHHELLKALGPNSIENALARVLA